MNFEEVIKRFQNAINEENQKKIDILCNIYLASSFENVTFENQYKSIEKLINEVKNHKNLSKVSLNMVKISILSKML
jgi:hypothetical protein